MIPGFFSASAAGGVSPPGPSGDFFEAVLWTGNGTGDATVPTSLDLSDGALVWVKRRDSSGNHTLYFKSSSVGTVRAFSTNNTTAASSPSAALDNGSFTVPDNINGATYVAWVFKVSPGNFNIVEYTGDGVTGRTVAHGMGATPKMVLTSPLSGANINYLQHIAFGGTQNFRFDSNAILSTSNQQWNNSTMDTNNVTLGSSTLVNGNGAPFALFAFGGDDLSTGVFEGDSVAVDINVGFVPRFIGFKRVTATSGGWAMFDTARTPAFSGNDALLIGDTAGGDVTNTNYLTPTANGVSLNTSLYNSNGADTMFWAIK